MFYSISAQRWYRIELKVLIVVFLDKDLHVVLLQGKKWTEYLRLRKKEGHFMRKCLLYKEWIEKKGLMDIDPRREDKAIRVHFEKCLLCTLYQEEFILSSVKVLISQYMFNLTNVGLSMCVMEYSDLFLNLMWANPGIYVWKSMIQYPHDGVKLA